MCSSGLAPTAARGMRASAVPPLWVGTSQCCSGCVPMAARGLSGRVLMQLRMGTWLCCSGCMPMAARGMCGRAGLPLGVGIWLCCTGLAPMDARRTSLPRTADCDSGARRATATSRRGARTTIDVSLSFPTCKPSAAPSSSRGKTPRNRALYAIDMRTTRRPAGTSSTGAAAGGLARARCAWERAGECMVTDRRGLAIDWHLWLLRALARL
jgi:hypothetical protein